MAINITKQGIINTSAISETFVNPLDTNFYVEPDGSVWIRIYHHNNPAAAYFGSTMSNFEKPYYIDADRWFNVALCNKITNNTYEFMVKSAPESTSTESKYRWIQTKNPMTAVFADVAAANVTKITTSGYSSFSWGGIYKFGTNTYLCANNGTNGNWWGAIGTWTIFQNGTPGWTTIIKTGYQDLYLRIDNQVNTNGVSVFNNSIISNNFIEI